MEDNQKLVLQREFVVLGEDIQKLAGTRQQLMIQLNENEGVREEFQLLSNTATIFREIGPTLVKTDPAEARLVVDGRIDMIQKDLKKIAGLVEEKGKRRMEVQALLQAAPKSLESPALKSSGAVAGKE